MAFTNIHYTDRTTGYAYLKFFFASFWSEFINSFQNSKLDKLEKLLFYLHRLSFYQNLNLEGHDE